MTTTQTIVLVFDEKMSHEIDIHRYSKYMPNGLKFESLNDESLNELGRIYKSLHFQFLNPMYDSHAGDCPFRLNFIDNGNFSFIKGNSYKLQYQIRKDLSFGNNKVCFYITKSEDLGIVLSDNKHGTIVEIL
jgi:hypothetical protein